jgi:hypothetical protein
VAHVGEEAAFGLVHLLEPLGLLLQPAFLLFELVPLLAHLLGPFGDGLLQLLLPATQPPGVPPVSDHGQAQED